MIELMDLRPGNYIHPAAAAGGPDHSRFLRVLSLDLIEKQITAKPDHDPAIYTLSNLDIFPCVLENLSEIIGGLSFGEHSLLLREGLVSILHENGSPFVLPHILYVHQFQNLVRSLTGAELPFNINQGQKKDDRMTN